MASLSLTETDLLVQVDAWNFECLKREARAPDEAYAFACRAQSQAEAIGYDDGLAHARRNLGFLQHTRGDNAAARDLLESALELASRPNATRALCLHTLALLHQRTGDLDGALDRYEEALRLRERLDDLSGQARTLNNIGTAHFDRDDLDASVAAHSRALDIWRSLDNRYGEAFTLNNLGTIYLQLDDPVGARRYHDQALDAAIEAGDHALTATCHINRSRVFLRDDNAEPALREAEAARSEALQLGDLRLEGAALQQRGRALAALGRSDEARKDLARGLRLIWRHGSHRDATEALLAIGRLHLEVGAPALAEAALKRCLRLAEAFGQHELRRDIYLVWTDCAAARGDFERALERHRRYHELDREWRTARAERRRQAVLTELALEQARREAELHRQRSEALSTLHAQLERTNARLQELADQDGMTGLLHHRAFHERLRREFEKAVATREPLGLILLDVDDFKRYNDSFGHPAGDRVLCAVAQLLREQAGRAGLLARYGGEEFAVLLPGAERPEASALAERLRSAIAAHTFPNRSVTVSVGVSATYGTEADPIAVVERADRALYQAKRTGRNRVDLAA